jgi:hypothetical protein
MSMPDEPQISEEELRALEAELERIHVDDVILQTVVSLINLGARKASEGRTDQLQIAIEGVRALLPVIEPRHAEKLAPIRDALSQLQLQFAKGGAAPGGSPDAPGQAPKAEEPKPSAQASGRLWVPGQ